ncbi:Protein of unknown function [Cribrihabitans marinus]|uniref:Methyltransferase domain-containing protein n=1 Tax=Cribrihabitans marinus TaxID=1227549 RepID=A0A1H6RNK4_9RHOB|nr:DUF938 domain-containing protein [Cribrihabitans marinus]GGH20873.1 methyltransferase [Cribrihabitans marinus]SEI53175.1 Protein of unknown function [Cribrihabitans marinus]
MNRRPLPPQASVATPGEGGRLVAPAASRNAEALGDLLARVAPAQGRALELASGTGQHVAAFAERFPALQWQPTEIAPARRASIDAYCKALPNVAPALELDATRPGWSAEHPGQDLILLVNLLHLISAPEAETLIAEAARALSPGGTLAIYGPFMRSGALTSDGDRRFHAALSAQDPAIGYKDDQDILDLGAAAGLEVAERVEMPANNLALVWRR